MLLYLCRIFCYQLVNFGIHVFSQLFFNTLFVQHKTNQNCYQTPNYNRDDYVNHFIWRWRWCLPCAGFRRVNEAWTQGGKHLLRGEWAWIEVFVERNRGSRYEPGWCFVDFPLPHEILRCSLDLYFWNRKLLENLVTTELGFCPLYCTKLVKLLHIGPPYINSILFPYGILPELFLQDGLSHAILVGIHLEGTVVIGN